MTVHSTPMLSVRGIDVFIQASHILRTVSLEVGDREVVCLVGRNGAGKTTTLRTIMGYLRPRAGEIAFRGTRIDGRRTHEIARLGLGWAPEDSGIFPDLTVAENIEIATWTRRGGRPAAERIAHAYEVFPVLRTYAARKGPEMSGGERKMLSIARALALDPEMLILDEPFEGLSPAIVPVIADSLATVTRRGYSILIAESNIYHVPDYADRLYVIERGEIVFAGKPHDAWADAAVVRIVGHGGPATEDPQTPSGHGGPATEDPQTPSGHGGPATEDPQTPSGHGGPATDGPRHGGQT